MPSQSSKTNKKKTNQKKTNPKKKETREEKPTRKGMKVRPNKVVTCDKKGNVIYRERARSGLTEWQKKIRAYFENNDSQLRRKYPQLYEKYLDEYGNEIGYVIPIQERGVAFGEIIQSLSPNKEQEKSLISSAKSPVKSSAKSPVKSPAQTAPPELRRSARIRK